MNLVLLDTHIPVIGLSCDFIISPALSESPDILNIWICLFLPPINIRVESWLNVITVGLYPNDTVWTGSEDIRFYRYNIHNIVIIRSITFILNR